jgi:SUKH-3 immunity protein
MSENNIFNRFSDSTKEILRLNGIDGVIKMQVQKQAQEIELEFVREGYNISNAARDFLELCAYSEIRFLHNKKTNSHVKLIVDPTGYIDLADRIELYNSFGKQLYTIAFMSDGYEIMLDENENVYLFWDGNWNFLGSDLIAGIEEIFKGEGSRLDAPYAQKSPC